MDQLEPVFYYLWYKTPPTSQVPDFSAMVCHLKPVCYLVFNSLLYVDPLGES